MFASKSYGFTLIELMVVVGIIGLLAAVAIPNFARFVAKARQSEAKTLLAELAKTELVHYQDHGTFTDNLMRTGWAPMGEPIYLYGFTTDQVPSGSSCNDTSECLVGFNHDKMMDIFGTPLTGGDLPDAPVSQHGFTIGAVGNIDNDAALDQWTLNDFHVFTEVTSDLNY